ncbi:MAG: ATP-binding protein [Bacillota bacterium]
MQLEFLLTSLFEVIVAALFMNFVMLQKNKGKTKTIVFLVVSTIVLFSYSAILKDHVTLGIDILVGRLILAGVWCAIYKEKILFSFASFFVLGILEILFAVPILHITHLLTFPGVLVEIPVVVKMLCVVLIFNTLEGFGLIVLGKKNININLYERLTEDKYFRTSGLLFQIFIMTMFVTLTLSNQFIFTQKIALAAILLLLSVLLNISNIWDYRTRNRISRLEEANLAQVKVIDLIETNIQLISKEKHDFNNHLSAIMGMCSLEDTSISNKIKNYIMRLTNEKIEIERNTQSGSDYVDALLAIKFHVASNLGIEHSAIFEAKLDGLLEFEIEMVAIFGNIIDNAIDALNASKSNVKRLDIKSEMLESNLVVSISNNGPSISEKYLEKIFELNFSTKADGAPNRGFGLPIVAENIAKIGGTVSVASSNEKTIFKVIFLDQSTLESSKSLSVEMGV